MLRLLVRGYGGPFVWGGVHIDFYHLHVIDQSSQSQVVILFASRVSKPFGTTMSVVRTIILILHRLTLLLARKLLHLILPYTIPIFPTPSHLFANFVGINPFAIKPKPLPIPPLLKNLPKLMPPVPIIFDPFNLMGNQRRQGQSSDSVFPDPTPFALGDKIRTWGERNKLASRLTGDKLERSRKTREAIGATTPFVPPPTKKDVEEETPIEGMNRIVAEGLDNLERVRPLYPLSPLLSISFHSHTVAISVPI